MVRIALLCEACLLQLRQFPANDLSNHDPVYQEIWKQKTVDDACFGVDASDPKQAQIQIGKQDPSKYQADHAWKINVDITEGHWTAPKVQFYVGSTEIGSGAQNVVIGEILRVFFKCSRREHMLG